MSYCTITGLQQENRNQYSKGYNCYMKRLLDIECKSLRVINKKIITEMKSISCLWLQSASNSFLSVFRCGLKLSNRPYKVSLLRKWMNALQSIYPVSINCNVTVKAIVITCYRATTKCYLNTMFITNGELNTASSIIILMDWKREIQMSFIVFW